jgi:dolichol-phosphate mannosyltransferase
MSVGLEARPKTIEFAVIVPCFNERNNIEILISKLEHSLVGIEWEVIFVDDDSPDGTARAARDVALINPRVRCIQRIGRRGLATAVIEGMPARHTSPSSTAIYSTTSDSYRRC